MPDKKIQSKYCFVCGRDNPHGLRVPFYFNGDSASAKFIPGKEHCGFDGIVHSGILFSLLDEAMMHLIHANGLKAITVEVKVRMKKIAFAGMELQVKAGSLETGRHMVKCSAEISHHGGDKICIAEGKFLYYSNKFPFEKSW